MQTVSCPESNGRQVRVQNHTTPRDDGSNATPRRHYRYREATRGERLRAVTERSNRRVRRSVVHDIIVMRDILYYY